MGDIKQEDIVIDTKINKTDKSVKKASRTRKRKRVITSSSEDEDVLPENLIEVENNIQTTAVKNNMDENSVKKILKKVVTNDHVLALVKLKEEEEIVNSDTDAQQPKLTRAKLKEIREKVSCTTTWGIDKLELTPIEHIPVKTRPEVKALIAQELPEDEDDEEYKPSNDDAPSDDDQTMESCSDLESLPATPATPHNVPPPSPSLKDGPFKLPQTTPVKRKLDMTTVEEEATIALRTRSKLSLSATTIEHIESTFVPPDDIPCNDVDDLWNEFLKECLDPATNSKHEEDDEADPEYNLAADPDLHDDDETDEGLDRTLQRISKKELNDLFSELFEIFPNPTDQETSENLLEPANQTDGKTMVDENGKQESEINNSTSNDKEQTLEITKDVINGSDKDLDPGKRDDNSTNDDSTDIEDKIIVRNKRRLVRRKKRTLPQPPPIIRLIRKKRKSPSPPPEVSEQNVNEDVNIEITIAQRMILEQQLRQHIQLAASNFLQLHIHPIHWKYAPAYKQYLESLEETAKSKPNSIVNVCNLIPAVELIRSWEKTVSSNTPENVDIVEYIKKEAVRWRKRFKQNAYYVGDFHDTIKSVVANSPVFLYPYLLPAMPYRPDGTSRRSAYLQSEDEYIALGLQQFWDYVEANPRLFKLHPRYTPRSRRVGLSVVLELICKHMMPWMPQNTLLAHIHQSRKKGFKENPISKFLDTGEVVPVEHKILPFIPNSCLYESPESEMPYLWVRYLAKSSKRFRTHHRRRTYITGLPPVGVSLDSNITQSYFKQRLPIDYSIVDRERPHSLPNDTHDHTITVTSLVENTNGSINARINTGICLVPIDQLRSLRGSSDLFEDDMVAESPPRLCQNALPVENNSEFLATVDDSKQEHCRCCLLLKKICKRQSLITDYFVPSKKIDKACQCRDREYPRMSNRLKQLLVHYKRSKTECVWREVLERKKVIRNKLVSKNRMAEEKKITADICDPGDTAFVASFILKISNALNKNSLCYKRLNKLLKNFDIEAGKTCWLISELLDALNPELLHLQKEFLQFLTPKQADEIGEYRDYFIQMNSLDIINKIEEEIDDVDVRNELFLRMDQVYVGNKKGSCEICHSLLESLSSYPKVAEYIFSLFPHRYKSEKVVTSVPTKKKQKYKSSSHVCETRDYSSDDCLPAQETNQQTVVEDTEDVAKDTEDMAKDTEDVAKDTEDVAKDTKDVAKVKETKHNGLPDIPVTDDPTPNDTNSQDITIEETMVQGYDQSENSKVLIKIETIEWTRDEDKVLLEVLKDCIKTKDPNKNFLEVLEERKVYESISETLTNKPVYCVKSRLLYLLEMIVMDQMNQLVS